MVGINSGRGLVILGTAAANDCKWQLVNYHFDWSVDLHLLDGHSRKGEGASGVYHADRERQVDFPFLWVS